MYRSFDPAALGISGRQSEIIEVALTFGYRGLVLDFPELLKRVEERGVEQATRFLSSAQLKIGGFELPDTWREDEATFKSNLGSLAADANTASAAGVSICHGTVLPGTDYYPYHENFEIHRQRLGEIADVLAPHNVRLALDFLVAPAHREGREFQFIADAEAMVLLIKSIGSPNVGLALDSWNWHFGGGTTDLIQALGANQVFMFSIADAMPGTTQDGLTEEQRVMPCEEGIVEIGPMLEVLRDGQFDGPVTLAPHPTCLTEMNRDTIVKECRQVFDTLWAAAGLTKRGKLATANA
ncbi:MAG: TIM barrel protein [Pirellulaceae bacterium]|jgi:sugar phosphate isomerase/epimerase|nr:TIM barrel protein [Pirellulaceae bacterium]MDP6719505.1 TIM barrel protein [Pirellulaceae bacterium]